MISTTTTTMMGQEKWSWEGEECLGRGKWDGGQE